MVEMTILWPRLTFFFIIIRIAQQKAKSCEIKNSKPKPTSAVVDFII